MTWAGRCWQTKLALINCILPKCARKKDEVRSDGNAIPTTHNIPDTCPAYVNYTFIVSTQ